MENMVQYIRTNNINWNMYHFPCPTYKSTEENNRKTNGIKRKMAEYSDIAIERVWFIPRTSSSKKTN
jgi:hypothetical protein